MSTTGKSILTDGMLLALIAVIGVTLLSGVYLLTRERISEQEKQVILRQLEQVLPMSSYDNDLLIDRIEVRDPAAFAHNDPVPVYRARLAGEPVAVIMMITAPDGYNGNIRMLVSIHVDGSIGGVRVVAHRETPGLGDPIEISRSDWIEGFRGRSSVNPGPEGWLVRKDGGEFDQFTGATITPRAVVAAVWRAVQYHDLHQSDLYDIAAPESNPNQDQHNE